jgi:hypothetical protein
MPIPVSIGIIGGMGPWVDPLLLEKLLVHQSALGMRRDQEAIPLLLAQWAPLVEDRTEYLDKTLPRRGRRKSRLRCSARLGFAS